MFGRTGKSVGAAVPAPVFGERHPNGLHLHMARMQHHGVTHIMATNPAPTLLAIVLPVRVALTTGEAHDNRLVLTMLSGLKSGAMLLADRGFDADWIRGLVTQRGAWANIPPKCNRKEPIYFSPHLYRARNLVERFFNKIKQCRRVATRYDKLAANYLAFVQLASIRLWLRVNESTPTATSSPAVTAFGIRASLISSAPGCPRADMTVDPGG
jgi:transposase